MSSRPVNSAPQFLCGNEADDFANPDQRPVVFRRPESTNSGCPAAAVHCRSFSPCERKSYPLGQQLVLQHRAVPVGHNEATRIAHEIGGVVRKLRPKQCHPISAIPSHSRMSGVRRLHCVHQRAYRVRHQRHRQSGERWRRGQVVHWRNWGQLQRRETWMLATMIRTLRRAACNTTRSLQLKELSAKNLRES